MKAKWVIGLSIVVALLGVVLPACRQEVSPQVAGGYGPSHLYIDPDWELWTDVRSMQDGGNVISVDDGGGALSTIAFDDAVASDGNTNVAAWAFIDETNYRAVLIKNEIFNGTTWDRERNNVEGAILASASRTATTNSDDQTNYNGSRLLVIVDVTGVTATPIVTPTLQAKDSASSEYFIVWTATTPLTAVGTTAYYFADGASGGSFTEILAFGLPSRTWRVRMIHHGADAITYTVGSTIGIH